MRLACCSAGSVGKPWPAQGSCWVHQHPQQAVKIQEMSLVTGTGHWPSNGGGIQGRAAGLQDGALERPHGSVRV